MFVRDAEKLSLRNAAGGAVIAVKVVPGASRDKIAGVLGDALKIATSAPPEKGKANQAVGELLAKSLGVAARDVALHAGGINPRKEFLVRGLSAAQVRLRLERL